MLSQAAKTRVEMISSRFFQGKLLVLSCLFLSHLQPVLPVKVLLKANISEERSKVICLQMHLT